MRNNRVIVLPEGLEIYIIVGDRANFDSIPLAPTMQAKALAKTMQGVDGTKVIFQFWL